MTDTCLSVFLHGLRLQFILTWQGRHHDHEGGSPSARLGHCTPCFADPSEFPKCGNLDCIISGSGGLRSRSPLMNCQNQSINQATQPTVTVLDLLWLRCCCCSCLTESDKYDLSPAATKRSIIDRQNSMSHSLLSVVYKLYLQQTSSLTAIPP